MKTKNNFLIKSRNFALYAAQITALCAILIMFFTHDCDDPSWNNAVSMDITVHNVYGKFGAICSDLILQIFGVSIIFFLIFKIILNIAKIKGFTRNNNKKVILLSKVVMFVGIMIISNALDFYQLNPTHLPGNGGLFGNLLLHKNPLTEHGSFQFAYILIILCCVILFRIRLRHLIYCLHAISIPFYLTANFLRLSCKFILKKTEEVAADEENENVNDDIIESEIKTEIAEQKSPVVNVVQNNTNNTINIVKNEVIEKAVFVEEKSHTPENVIKDEVIQKHDVQQSIEQNKQIPISAVEKNKNILLSPSKSHFIEKMSAEPKEKTQEISIENPEKENSLEKIDEKIQNEPFQIEQKKDLIDEKKNAKIDPFLEDGLKKEKNEEISIEKHEFVEEKNENCNKNLLLNEKIDDRKEDISINQNSPLQSNEENTDDIAENQILETKEENLNYKSENSEHISEFNSNLNEKNDIEENIDENEYDLNKNISEIELENDINEKNDVQEFPEDDSFEEEIHTEHVSNIEEKEEIFDSNPKDEIDLHDQNSSTETSNLEKENFQHELNVDNNNHSSDLITEENNDLESENISIENNNQNEDEKLSDTSFSSQKEDNTINNNDINEKIASYENDSELAKTESVENDRSDSDQIYDQNEIVDECYDEEMFSQDADDEYKDEIVDDEDAEIAAFLREEEEKECEKKQKDEEEVVKYLENEVNENDVLQNHKNMDAHFAYERNDGDSYEKITVDVQKEENCTIQNNSISENESDENPESNLNDNQEDLTQNDDEELEKFLLEEEEKENKIIESNFDGNVELSNHHDDFDDENQKESHYDNDNYKHDNELKSEFSDDDSANDSNTDSDSDNNNYNFEKKNEILTNNEKIDDDISENDIKHNNFNQKMNNKFANYDCNIEFLVQPDDTKCKTQDRQFYDAKGDKLLEVLNDFKIQGRILDVYPGPVVDLFEFEPIAGTKSSRVITISTDIARSMCALSARISIIHGKNAIGIELPNPSRDIVFLRELLEFIRNNDEFQLPIALGKRIDGSIQIVDLTKMPHLLIAGTTGSGKSVAINTMIISLLFKLSPKQCRLIMIDPKMLELSIYNDIPHLLTPVITDPKQAIVALKWIVKEMEERYQIMTHLNVRNISGYNERIAEAKAQGEPIKIEKKYEKDGEIIIKEVELEELPFIVVIVDEMADLMIVTGKEIEILIQRLAQMARAAGIHIIMATQRPSVDVITGVIKANFPTRISFAVTSKIDSRTILGEQGAEQLLGMGDMLYMPNGGKIMRLHGAFVSDNEVEEIVESLKRDFGKADYVDEIEQIIMKEAPTPLLERDFEPNEDDDELLLQAMEIIVEDQKTSISYIQRKLRIGYNRAANLIERMEKEGFLSPPDNSGKRQING